MQSDNDRALLNLQRRLERQFFEGSRLDPDAKRWVLQVYETVANVVGSGVAVSAAFDVISALNADIQESRDSMIAPPVAGSSDSRATGCSGDESGSGSSSEGEGGGCGRFAPLWLEALLPLPLSCRVVPVALPLPQSMNSRILTASPGADSSALLGYVQCNNTTGYSLHLMTQHDDIGIPLELNLTVAQHCPALFSGDLLLVTDAWLVPPPSTSRHHCYLEVSRCHTIISATTALLHPQLPVSPSNLFSCRGFVDAITSASTASGRPGALVRVCHAAFTALCKGKPEQKVANAFVVIEDEDALASLSWARCSSEVHLTHLKPKNVSGVGKVFYSTPSTRCMLPSVVAAPLSSELSLATLYKAVITGLICSGIYIVNEQSILLFPGVCLRGHGRGLRTGNTIMISGLYAAGARDDTCQIWAANAAVDYVVVSSAPASAAPVGWQQFRGLDMFPWSTLASYLHPYAYLTLRSLVASMLHILSASVHDNDVVCTDGPAHQIMTALGWLVDAQMPILDGLQTRFFAASQGEAAVGCFAPMVVSLQFVKDCGTARTDSISQEEANQCDHNGGWQERVHSFPIQELCFSREPSMLEHMTSNTVSALQAAGHENVISTFVCDWHSRNAQQRILDHNLWLVGTVEFDDDSNSLVLTDSTHSMPLWLLPTVDAPVGSSIIVTHGELLLGVSDGTSTCAVLRAMPLKFTAPRPRTAGKISIMVRFITPGVLCAPVPNSWLDCVVVRSSSDPSLLPVVGDVVMVWLGSDAKELLSYARVGSVFSLHSSGFEQVVSVPSATPSPHKIFKLELHSPLLLQLEGWMPICLSAFAVNWNDLKMVKTNRKIIASDPDMHPDISLGSLQASCSLPNPFVRPFFAVQNLTDNYNLVSCMCVVKSSYHNWTEHEQVLQCRELSEDELKSVQHMLLDYSLDSIASPPSFGKTTTVTIKLDRLAVPQLVTPGCAIVLYRFLHRRTQKGVFIKCSPVSHIELLLPADWLPLSDQSSQLNVGDNTHGHPSDSQHLASRLLGSQAVSASDIDLNRWQRRDASSSADGLSCSYQLQLPLHQLAHLMDIRRNTLADVDVVANIVLIKSVSACFQCSVCSCVAVAGHAYLPNSKVTTATTADRIKADHESLVKTREMRCSRCRLSRAAVFTAKCVVQLDDGTDTAVAHAATPALFQAVLRLSTVSLERVADLVSREGAMQLLCANKRWERQQDAKRVSAASKILAEICMSQKVYRRVSVTASVLIPSSLSSAAAPFSGALPPNTATAAADAEASTLRLQVPTFAAAFTQRARLILPQLLALQDVDLSVRGHRLLSQLDQQLQAW